MQRELDKFFGPHVAAERPASADLAEWFVYMRSARRAGQRVSLKEVAAATQYDYGYVAANTRSSNVQEITKSNSLVTPRGSKPN